MDEELESEQAREESEGGTLRRKLEEAIDLNKRLTAELSSYKARDIIQTHGFTFVKPEDLEGVPPSEMEERARKIQEDLEARFKAVGVASGERADAEDGGLPEEKSEAFSRLREVTGGPGSAVPVVDLDKLTPMQKLELAFSQKSK